MTLPRLAVVHDRYAIDRVLRTPGLFSNTYLARDVETDDVVQLIEYYPEGLARRASSGVDVQVPEGLRRRLFDYGLSRFLEEHEALKLLSHPGVVSEQAAFQVHGTAYRVQEHEEGASLQTVLERRELLDTDAALAVLLPLLQGLAAAHDVGLIHGGVATSAVLLTQRGQPIWQHFRHAELRLAREMDVLPDVLLPGYAPPEQYLGDLKAGAWVDVYAAAALLYRMVSGQTLPDARHRLRHDEVPALVDDLGVDERLARALLHALELDPSARPSVAAWTDQLTALRQPAASPAEPERPAASIDAGATADQTAEVRELSADSRSQAAAGDAPGSQQARGEPAPAAAAPGQADAGHSAGDAPTTASDRAGKAAAAAPAVVDGDAGSRDDRAPVGGGERRSRPTKKVLMAAVVVAFVALLGVTYGSTLLVKGEADSGINSVQQAAFIVAEADTLMQEGHFEAARQLYQGALKVDPGNTVATARLTDAERALARRKRAAFLRLVSTGDSLMVAARSSATEDAEDGRRLLASAASFFLRALDLQPDDSLVMARLERATTQSLIREEPTPTPVASDPEPAPAEPRLDVTMVRAQMFEMLRDEGEARLSNGDTVGAERKFSEALDLQPDSALQVRLGQLRRVLGEREQREQLAATVARGERLLAAERYAAARSAFAEVLEFDPTHVRAQEQVRAIDERLQGEEQRMRQFEYLRAQGDVLLKQGDLSGAIQRYREAQAHADSDTVLQATIDRLVYQQDLNARRRDEDGVYTVPDVAPQLIGTQADLHRRARYPDIARRAGVQGRVYVQLVVDKDGRVQEAEVVRGIGGGCDQEAVRVLRKAKFEPGTVGGRPVKAQLTMYIDFQLSDLAN